MLLLAVCWQDGRARLRKPPAAAAVAAAAALPLPLSIRRVLFFVLFVSLPPVWAAQSLTAHSKFQVSRALLFLIAVYYNNREELRIYYGVE